MITLDMTAAASSDAEEKALYIKESGCFCGEITQAWKEISASGAVALKISFKRDDGAEAKNLSLWHTQKDGKKSFMEKQEQALLFVTKNRCITEKGGRIKKYSAELKMETDVEAIIYPELINKKIGLCLKSGINDYNGKIKLDIEKIFDPLTKLTASEAIAKLPAAIVQLTIEKYLSQPKIEPELYIKESSSVGITSVFQKPEKTNDYDDIPF